MLTMGFRSTVAVVLGSALVAVPAAAAVFCQKKSGAVFVRDACKKKETALDLASLGLQGPKGDKGDPGLPGAPGDTGPAGTARAYATSYSDGSGFWIAHNFTAINKVSPGVFCVTWDPSLGFTYNNQITPLVSAEYSGRIASTWSHGGSFCDRNTQIEVDTTDSSGASADTSFTIIIP